MNKTYIPTLVILVLLTVLHHYFSIHHFYVRYYGTDVLMHLLGGIGLACAINWVLATFVPKYQITFWKIVGLTLVAGIIWEVIEAVNDIAGAPVGTLAYYVDTAKDLCNDTLGAIIAMIFIKK